MINISNDFLTLKIDENCGKILYLENKKGNLLSNTQPPLLTLSFRGECGERIDTDVSNANSCDVVHNGNAYAIKYSDFNGIDLTATVFIDFDEKSKFINWRAKCESDLQLEWLEFPSFCVQDTFEDKGGNSEILFPYNEGAIVKNIKAREWSGFKYCEPEYPSRGSYSMYPGMICSPFLACLSDKGNIYIGSHDKNNNTKHIDFYRTDDGVRLVVRVYPGVDGGVYETDYDTVMTVFDGDWHDGAEIYRNWLEKSNSLNLPKIVENRGLPEWYEESPIVITYCVRGHHDTDIMEPNKLFPYINGLKVIDELAEKLDSKIMAILMHWEGTAPWAPPSAPVQSTPTAWRACSCTPPA